MTPEQIKQILDKHRLWLKDAPEGERANFINANLRWANLSRADLSRADISWANLRGADIDYSCWPLWCGSRAVKTDQRLRKQLLAHVADTIDHAPDRAEEEVAIYDLIRPFVKGWHQEDEFGELLEIQTEKEN